MVIVMRPGVDIIVVNYQTPQDTIEFLKSLPEQDGTWSLTLVNVQPTRQDHLLRHYVPDYSYVAFPDNVGYAKAVNRASTYGNRETLAIFNADTKLGDNVVKRCHEMLHYIPEWAVLGPKLIDEQNQITHAGFFEEPEGERGFHWLEKDGEFSDVREDALTVSGAAYFIKRSVWNELTNCPIYHTHYPEAEGAFLPTQHYYEETWCSYHARAHGYKVVYDGETTMFHAWHKASRVGGWAEEQIPESRRMFSEMCEAHGIQV